MKNGLEIIKKKYRKGRKRKMKIENDQVKVIEKVETEIKQKEKNIAKDEC